MKLDSPSVRSMTNVCQSWAGRYYRLAVVLFVLNAISALLFILFVNRIAYDDHYNITDVRRYVPFLGIIAFGLLPKLDLTRLLALGAMSLLGQGILWRYTLAG